MRGCAVSEWMRAGRGRVRTRGRWSVRSGRCGSRRGGVAAGRREPRGAGPVVGCALRAFAGSVALSGDGRPVREAGGGARGQPLPGARSCSMWRSRDAWCRRGPAVFGFAWVGRLVDVGGGAGVVVRGGAASAEDPGAAALDESHYEGPSTDRVIRPTPLGRRGRLQAGLPADGACVGVGARDGLERPLSEHARLVELLG